MELQVIQNKIYEIRGYKVMLDFDLAELYNIETRRLKEQAKRNIERFPEDFMFQLNKSEWSEVIANCDNLPENAKYSPATPFAFTQEGVAMLSGVLRSPVAIQANINIMCAFVRMRQFLIENREILKSISQLTKRVEALEEISEDTLASVNDLSEDTRKELDDIYIAMSELSSLPKKEDKPRNSIGFNAYKSQE
ncbi:ORF6N domain-containing protein [Bacteroides sp. UBA939]|uniref:ORF6N domain-containing protein n=1 Tax=Bacteroides sp. UBA939 TaxID=1946092 RepID=UPI0025C026B2|nr:ORF6N domain-containing protein [Bacteroides sp. UBA939]